LCVVYVCECILVLFPCDVLLYPSEFGTNFIYNSVKLAFSAHDGVAFSVIYHLSL
jgi:hypothetical protein